VSEKVGVAEEKANELREGRLSGWREMVLSIALPAAMIVLAESFFFVGEVETTLSVHGINLLFCVLTPLIVSLPPHIFQAFSLISVLRILNIGMPAFFDLTLYWLPFIYGPVIVVGYVVATREGGEGSIPPIRESLRYLLRGERDERIRWRMYYLPLAVVLGAVIALFEHELLRPESLIPEMTLANLVLLGTVMVVFVGLGEELLFRQILQGRLKQRLGVPLAILLSSLIFATMHSGYSSLPYLGFVFIVGLLIGYEFERTGSLVYVTLLHGFINIFLFSVFSLGSAFLI